MIRPQPTKRFHVDLGHKCNINCKFCYHTHEGDLRLGNFKSDENIIKEIDTGIVRENSWVDFTGGEPTLLKSLPDIIAYSVEHGLGTTVITNGLVNEGKIQPLLQAGLNEFLVSIHGTEKTHDFLTDKGVRSHQLRFLNSIVGKVPIRFNFVLNQFNQEEIVDTAAFMSQYSPKIVNFINFNPHHGWSTHLKDVEEVIAGLYIVEKNLNDAIELLESKGIGVNVRYYPMCRIAEKNRKYVCNDLHVIFDPYEWDYAIQQKNIEKFIEWIYRATNENECKELACKWCSLQWICGGINKYFVEVAGSQVLTRIYDEKAEQQKHNFYFYRQNNDLALTAPTKERRDVQ